jgi:predicted ester cyclase
MTTADETTATRNKAIIRSQFEFWNDGALEALGKDIGAEATNFRKPTDVDQVRRIIQNWRTAFPDLHYTVDTLLAEDDQVVAFCTLSGTQHGPLPLRGWAMLPVTGKHFTVKQMHLSRLRDGKVVEHWGVRDDLGMLVQLGHVTPPEHVGEHVADVLRDPTV